jgi:hypothetical protein
MQLYAVTCLWIAGKMKKVHRLSLASLGMICQNQYFVAAFKQKEAEITSLLNSRVGFPTAGVFLPAFLLEIEEDDKFDLAWFFLDVALSVLREDPRVASRTPRLQYCEDRRRSCSNDCEKFFNVTPTYIS